MECCGSVYEQSASVVKKIAVGVNHALILLENGDLFSLGFDTLYEIFLFCLGLNIR